MSGRSPARKPLPPFATSIRFEDVCFSYETDGDESREILRDINLKCRREKWWPWWDRAAPARAPLVHLIPRFFDVTAGRLLIDGRDVRDTTLSSLRSQIGVVTQETVLFNDTLRNNIAYGQPSISQKQVEAAARAALAHDFIMELPAGYDTMIGERGVRLSGGERQRIAIARALLKNAPILILDEATSALDSESESLVQSALAESDDRTHRVCDRSPPFHRPTRRPDCGAGKRHHRRYWRARRADAETRHLSPVV